jgi:hypothetical protein
MGQKRVRGIVDREGIRFSLQVPAKLRMSSGWKTIKS